VHDLPQFKLPNQEEQKKYDQAFGINEVLQVRQKENIAQRNEIAI
jgi:hypothetical protein